MNYEKLLIKTISNIIKHYYEDTELQKQEQESFKEKLCDMPSFIWSSEFGDLKCQLEENNNLHYLAKAYETFGMLEYSTEPRSFSSHYIALNAIVCSCLYYAKTKQHEYAAALAKLGYLKSRENLKVDLQALCEYQREVSRPYNIELLGDVSMFFDDKKAMKYYEEALNLFEDMDELDQYGYTCEYEYIIAKNNYVGTIELCFGEEINLDKLIDYGQERITEKMKLIEIIRSGK